MVIGPGARTTQVDPPAAHPAPIDVSCDSLRDLPTMHSPSVVVQRVMNVVMPLRQPDEARGEHTMADVKAELVIALARQRDAITTGLDNLGTIHFARFNIVGDALHLLSVYDGTLQGYVQEFAVQLGEAFDAILSFVAGWPPAPCSRDPQPVSVRNHPAEFVEWVMRRDLEQLQRDPTDLLEGALRAAVATTNGDGDLLVGGGLPLERLTRARLRTFFDEHPDAHLSMHRGYPGRSVAQIRQALEVGW